MSSGTILHLPNVLGIIIKVLAPSFIMFHLDLHCGDDNLVQVSDLHDGLISRDGDSLYNETYNTHIKSVKEKDFPLFHINKTFFFFT